MKKILLVFGTRPEAIKMAPLYLTLRKNPLFKTKILVTAQHRKMLDQILNIFKITPDYDLDLMAPNQSLSSLTSKVLDGCSSVYSDFKPDLVIVHGDTTTCMAGAMAAFYQGIKVAHLEAGLRTNNLHSPFPEEFNRQLTTKIASLHFCPTERSKENLIKEHIKESNILVTGNTVIDALFSCVDLIHKEKFHPNPIPLRSSDRPYVLITGHRRENFGQGIQNICSALSELAKNFPCHDFIYPVHLNPNIHDFVYKSLGNRINIFLIPPLEYKPFVYYMKNAKFILTDSGGVQEEAPALGIPLLVMRDQTERPEAIKSGNIALVGTNQQKIIKLSSRLINDNDFHSSMAHKSFIYGDGQASKSINDFLSKVL